MRLGIGGVVPLILNARIAVVVVRVRVDLELGWQQTGFVQGVPIGELLVGVHLAAILLLLLVRLVIDGLHLLVHFETYRIEFVKGLLEKRG